MFLDRSWSHDAMNITVLGVKIYIGRVTLLEAGNEQFKMVDDEFVAMVISWDFFLFSLDVCLLNYITGFNFFSLSLITITNTA